MVRSTKHWHLAVFLILYAIASSAFAQETTGSITGTVIDPSGGAVPGAKVEAVGPTLSLSMTTDNLGRYSFQTLPPGAYTVTATATGFRQIKASNVAVQVGRAARVDLTMEVGQVTETVVVSGEAILVDITTTTVATNVSQGFFDRLPKSRDFVSLIALAPGARSEPRGGGFQIDGASSAENVYTIDGMDVTNLQNGSLPQQARLPVEFVQELQVKSSGFEAQYGGAMGGVINVITRSGTNEFHGHAGLYVEHHGLNAGPRPSLRLDPLDDNRGELFYNRRDSYRLLNPTFSLGGPVIKNRLWFFTGIDPQMQRSKRNVQFLRTRQFEVFERNDRKDYFTGKLDALPTNSVRLYAGYMYTPSRVRGLLPTQQGTDSPTAPWSQLGSRTPSYSLTFGGDLTATPRLILSARGGYNYRNYKDYGTPPVPFIYYLSSSVGMAGVPAEVQASTGSFTANNRSSVQDIQTRFRLNTDVSYSFNFGGFHNIKAGYELNRLHNAPIASTWPYGYVRVGWDRTYRGVTVPGTLRGTYGYYLYRYFATSGNVSSNNMSLFFQDSWRPSRRLTLQLGLRTEREYLPAFRAPAGFTGKPIEFGFGEKFAPRLGAAYDVRGDGRWKIYGAFGLFYDLMKYELPRGSFGGDEWKDYVYPLNDPDIRKIQIPAPSVNAALPGAGTPFEVVDWRIPSDPGEGIDKNLKPMRRRVFDLGTEYSLTDTLALHLRYTHNQLDRAIEDVGTLGPQGEHYYIANPGFGLTVDPKTWEPGFPVTPKARRDYDAVEARLEKRFSRGFQFAGSYTWSRLWGNYGGLASSDENGRFSPNVNRYFDLPFMSFDKTGKEVLGLLATDRPHLFKFFGTYEWKNKLGRTNFGPSFQIASGTPVSTEVFMVSSTPIFVNGRGDLGRTPKYTQTDFMVYHDFTGFTGERFRFRLEANVTNLFNNTSITNIYPRYSHENDGQVQFDHEADFFKGFDYQRLMATQKIRVDPKFRMPSAFQGPREMRLGLKFIF